MYWISTLIKRMNGFYTLPFFFLLFISLFLSSLTADIALADSPITVNSFIDEAKNDGSCTLREAIIAANNDKRSGGKPNECPSGNGNDTIILPPGVYTLTRTDSGKENSSSTGDLDILEDVTIQGAGADVTIIQAIDYNDRVFHILAGSVSIMGVTIEGGNLSGDGGAIFNSGTLHLSDSQLDGNYADNGGAIFNEGTAVIERSTISNNTAASTGGAIANEGDLTIENSTISQNSADDAGLAVNSGTISLNYVTGINNTANLAVGGIENTGTFNVSNSILAANSGTDCQGPVQSDHTVWGNPTCTINVASDLIIGQGTLAGITLPDLLDVSLQHNGGTTPTHPLHDESPIADLGDTAVCPTTDQRGISRPRGTGCDIGAFEIEDPLQTGPVLTVNTNDDLDDGRCTFTHCSLREAINANTTAVTTIQFDLQAGETIEPNSPLPTIVQSVLLDGLQADDSLTHIDGSSAGMGADGVVIAANGTILTGLSLSNFGGQGIVVAPGISNVTLSGNEISHNDGLGIDVGGDGQTPNDVGELDGIQNHPVLIRAIPQTSGLQIVGRLNSTPSEDFAIEFFSNGTCDPSDFGEGETLIGETAVTTDASGNVNFNLTLPQTISTGDRIVATATNETGGTSEFSRCIVAGLDNTSWPTAATLQFGTDMTASAEQLLDLEGQSRWFKFQIEPNSEVTVLLSNLPKNYDLTLYKNIPTQFNTAENNQDLLRLGTEFAPDIFSPDIFSPDIFSPDGFSQDAYSPDIFSPDIFSPDIFSPDIFSPDIFSPDIFSPDIFSPDAYSPDIFSPDIFSPDIFSPDIFSPDIFSPEAFMSAQTRSLIAGSAFNGTVSEGIRVNTWNNTGEFYIRVRGRNGAFDINAPFSLDVQLEPRGCSDVTPITTSSDLPIVAGGFNTIILTDEALIEGSTAEKSILMSRLQTLAARQEVNGIIVDVSSDARVAAARTQALDNLACPYAQNLLAESIKEIVDAHRAVNPLAYVVIVGNDAVIPFFRYPDQALLANEKNYVPPVQDNTASQASLRLGYVLGQDAYGASIRISNRINEFPIPDLPVGRLVETAVDVTHMLDAYLSTTDGIITPNSALATGYDFLADAAFAIDNELNAGIGTSDTLINGRDVSPEDPQAWDADDLRQKLLGNRHDVIFLAGHFSASSALAADYKTRMVTEDLINASVDLTNVLVFSAGCHAGYNIVNADGIPQVTNEPDWAQAFAQKGAVLISGTGYQYGDTDFIKYAEQLYLDFSRQLRTGTGPVAIGDAFVNAKQGYLASTPELRGIHEKTLLEATIFGLPMMKINMTGDRLSPQNNASLVSTPQTFTSNPGNTLGLSYADVNIDPLLVERTVQLDLVDATGAPVDATYFEGKDGVVSNPSEPTLPLAVYNITVPGSVMRGVGFRGGLYQDLEDVIPLTGAATTEIRGVHTPFVSDILYPVRVWQTNYFDALIDQNSGITQLMLTPTQFQTPMPGSALGTMRRFDEIDLRLFYSGNVTTYANGNQPALAAPPEILGITAVPNGNQVDIEVTVIGDPSAGVQEVWVTYTGNAGSLYGAWQSVNLTQQNDSTLWRGFVPMGTTNPEDLRFMVQAVNGVGLVNLMTNQGAFFSPFDTGLNPDTPTEVLIETTAVSGAYGEQTEITAVLTSNGTPLANQPLFFGVGAQRRLATTDGQGRASIMMPLLGLPGSYELKVNYLGTAVYQPSIDSTTLTISKRDTQITLTPVNSSVPLNSTNVIQALLTDDGGRPLGEKTVFFVISGPNGSYDQAVITDYAGRATLPELPLPLGDYTVTVYFAGVIPLSSGINVTLIDQRYNETDSSGTVSIVNQAPTAEADAYATDEDTPLTVVVPGVLNNDSDADNHILTAVLVASTANGTLQLNADGSFVYTPDDHFNGSDSFTYRASDGIDESDAVAVSLTVNAVNDAPGALPESYSLDQDTSLTVSVVDGVLANDSDIDGDELTAVVADHPTHGALTLNADGSFVYTPDAGFFGNDSFTYTAFDGALHSEPVTVDLEVIYVNHDPDCSTAITDLVTLWPNDKRFEPVSIMNVTDIDGDAVSITIVSIFQDEPVGKGKNAPDGKGIGTATAEIRAERDGNGDGRVYHITFTADDGMGGSCTATLRLGVVPHDQGGDLDAIDGGPLYDSTKKD